METMTWDQFIEQYKPIKNELDDNASFDGMMFETYGEELKFVMDQPSTRIWTILDNDDAEPDPKYPDEPTPSAIISGYHLVNRLGYLLTRESHDDEFIEVIDD